MLKIKELFTKILEELIELHYTFVARIVKVDKGGIGFGGLRTTDSIDHEYPLIKDNGTNLWIGAEQSASQHHRGRTYISTGYNGTSGNESLYVSVPNANNDGGTTYQVLHTGNYPNNIGAWNGSASLPDISVASSTSGTTEIGKFTLPKGIYLIIIFVQWSANANGRRYINLAKTSGATSGATVWQADSVSATPVGVCTQRLICTLDNTADTDWYLNALQNSGSNLTARIRYNFIKLQ